MINDKLFQFIEDSPTCYHAVETIRQKLQASGFKQLPETDPWTLEKGGRYFVTRNRSSLIAFQIPHEPDGGFHIAASHSDSPSFKLKENPEIKTEKNYVKLNVEKYGGMIMPAWLDRPLSIAGRVLVQEGASVSTKLVDIKRDLVLIPSVAIHMNKEINQGFKYNPQVDLLPLYSDGSETESLMEQIARCAGTEASQILGSDLFLYNPMGGRRWGAHKEYISCPRLDDLQGVFASFQAFLSAEHVTAIPVCCTLDNEEVGSSTKQGAASTFLKDTLSRILLCLGKPAEAYHTALAKSFLLSVDNAHAVHPNHPEKNDPTNRPYMNQGVVIKYNASQKYTTDAVSAAIFKSICKAAHIPCQSFLNRSDMAGGSTLGNIASTQTPMNAVDLGVAQLAMHSPYETAGAKDTEYLIKAIKACYESRIHTMEDGAYQIE